jgi:hypothetical protein
MSINFAAFMTALVVVFFILIQKKTAGYALLGIFITVMFGAIIVYVINAFIHSDWSLKSLFNHSAILASYLGGALAIALRTAYVLTLKANKGSDP